MPDVIAVAGPTPHNAPALGVFHQRSELLNGRPSYVKAYDPSIMVWWAKSQPPTQRGRWWIGEARHKGKSTGCFSVASDKPLEDTDGTWEVGRHLGSWEADLLAAPGVKILVPNRKPADHADDVAITGERTFAQRDAESRMRAIDLEAEPSRKRGRAATSEMEERVAKARSVCSAAVDQRARELAKPAFEEYMDDKIDAAELDKRKAAARQKAAAEHKPLATLDAAFSADTKAVAAREAADEAAEAEDAADAELVAALRALEKAGWAGRCFLFRKIQKRPPSKLETCAWVSGSAASATAAGRRGSAIWPLWRTVVMTVVRSYSSAVVMGVTRHLDEHGASADATPSSSAAA